jgi:hypothetical protein
MRRLSQGTAQMAEPSSEELCDFLAGTCIGITSIVELLIHKKIVSREELRTLLLSRGNMTRGHRRAAIMDMLNRVESGRARYAIDGLSVPIAPDTRWPDVCHTGGDGEYRSSYYEELAKLYALYKTAYDREKA